MSNSSSFAIFSTCSNTFSLFYCIIEKINQTRDSGIDSFSDKVSITASMSPTISLFMVSSSMNGLEPLSPLPLEPENLLNSFFSQSLNLLAKSDLIIFPICSLGF